MNFFQQAAPAPALASRMALAATLLAALALAGCNPANGKGANKNGEAETVAVPVEVAAPVFGDMEAVYTGTASITADHTAIVVFIDVLELSIVEGLCVASLFARAFGATAFIGIVVPLGR